MAFDLTDEELEYTRTHIPGGKLLWAKERKRIEEMAKKEEKKMSKVSMGSLYDANKTLIKQYAHELTKNEYAEKVDEFNKFMLAHKGQYYMLLCHDRRDYTLFNMVLAHSVDEPYHIIWNELTECLYNRGKIYGFDKTQDGMAIEIWVVIDDEPYCYYFFNYDAAVIEC